MPRTTGARRSVPAVAAALVSAVLALTGAGVASAHPGHDHGGSGGGSGSGSGGASKSGGGVNRGGGDGGTCENSASVAVRPNCR